MATKKKAEEAKTIRIRQVRSSIACKQQHRDALRGLGLRHPHHEVERIDTPAVRGLVHKVAFMVEVSEVAS
jgi:large subunit ribosomal protein L30